MTEYHKIQTVFKRDPAKKNKTLLFGEFSLPEFEYLQNNNWIFTEKVDGTTIRIMFDGSTIRFGGKTNNASISALLVERLNNKFLPQLSRFKDKFSESAKVCLCGEGYGGRIQSGGHYRNDPDFVLFDVNIDEWWLTRDNVEDIANYFGIQIVPIIGNGNLNQMIEQVKQGFKSQWGDFNAEGIVARPEVELKSRNGERIITKLKHKDF